MQIKPSNFYFNPFGGVAQEDIPAVIVPKPEVVDLLGEIKGRKPMLVELVGKQGRGKTTHLKWLKENFPEIPLYLLNKGSELRDLIHDSSKYMFVDSIHHLGIRQRIELFRCKEILVYTTHFSRRVEVFAASKAVKVVKFKGINPRLLKAILRKRLELAIKDPEGIESALAAQNLDVWIAKHGDNYRGIINSLFSTYQQL